ncbi:carbonic anhydrase [Campylobacter sp. RM9344]|uniref:Carbonic anhydrase n=1 Tax=Campylobacter californiensis TaxID=1032243 RepID=A0AAW3ZWH4_9BACT|nr:MULTISPECIES: carbonic anhydrase [unclassified Campylobacter]MBE2985163.1 carbonic anhydrase [Campylobacter sp. RM6883]MBE2987012.1 carbonic anhydrase [Campylobacter sp. RM12919]MBE2988657.1 carbonic anhydrase [Campylobacter sp. RM12920]MBE2995240.1 carbonic anhydrase [Campylobacter sp. RM6913]MBE3029882.1 carbonic anhydrase [Campylobacter sp. RM9344]
MQSLLEGAVKFMEDGFLEHKELFESLQHAQDPHTLFVSCVDSRVVPNLITNCLPGELFMVRNIANIVPPYRVSSEFLATTSAIEYALEVLNIKNIIICGHSNCGGCGALYQDESKFINTPNVKNWIKLIEPIKYEVLKFTSDDPAKMAWLTERLNVINSIENILTYPNVERNYLDGNLAIYGWHYIIETGEIFSYDLESKTFKLLAIRQDTHE